METPEEIKKLKALLDQGAITEEEYLTLSNELEQEKKNKEDEEAPRTVINKTKSKLTPDLRIIGNLTRIPENVVTAGKSIKSSVGYKVVSYLCNIIGVIILVISFFEGISSISEGGNFGGLLGGDGSTVALIFFLLGIVFWVISISKLDRAGSLLMKSEAAYSERKIIEIVPSSKKTEFKGLKIGQEFAGGIIAYFDKTGKYLSIAAKTDLPEKMNLQQAKIACDKYDCEGYNDWFLPDVSELRKVNQNLKEHQFGSIKNEKYWIKNNVIDFSDTERFSNGVLTPSIKTDLNNVRPIRFIKIQEI